MALEKANMIIPIIRAEIHDFTISAGVGEHTVRGLNTGGQLPSRMIFGLIDNLAFSGNINKNPYYFNNYNLASADVSIGDSISPYSDPIKIDFKKNKFMQAYDTLFRGINPQLEKYGNGISHEMFKNNTTLICFDLTADECGLDVFNVKSAGYLSLSDIY